MVKAKFIVTSVTSFKDQAKVALTAVTSGGGNEDWSKYTPAGAIEMTITNMDAAARFKPGVSYHVTFVEAA